MENELKSHLFTFRDILDTRSSGLQATNFLYYMYTVINNKWPIESELWLWKMNTIAVCLPLGTFWMQDAEVSRQQTFQITH